MPTASTSTKHGTPARVFRTKEVARILATTPGRVRRHVHAGLCNPSRKGHAFEFSFQDLVLLRAAHGLVSAGIPTRRVHRTLSRVARRLRGRPLSSLRFDARGNDVLVREGRSVWDPDSGQLLFSFRVADLAKATKLITESSTGGKKMTAREREHEAGRWFARGVDLEQAGDYEAARTAYRESVDIEPDHADACINLGRLLHQEGNHGEASRFYKTALGIAPDDPVARYNFALLLEDQGRPAAAVTQYRAALDLQPHFADAHYNLARLFEDLGRNADAAQHLLMYSRLTDGS